MTAGNDHTAPAPKPFERWSLREEVIVEGGQGDGPLRLRGRWGEFVVERPSPLVREALGRMDLGPVSLANAMTRQGPGGTTEAQLADLYQVFDRLQPLIVRSLSLESGQPLLSVVPLTVRSRFHPVPLAADIPVRLSAFAALRTDGNMYRLESPLTLHRVLLHGPEAVMLIALLGAPVAPAALAETLPAIGEAATAAFEYLAAAGMVVQAEETSGELPVFGEEIDPSLINWSPTDLTFHALSTLGRHDHDFGVTVTAEDRVPPQPVVKPQAEQGIRLHRPRWEELRAADPTLTTAIEGRRSIRRHGAEPVTVTELGDLLYRTARVRSLITVDPGDGAEAGGGGASYELSDRPYPSGGACYELELYVTVGNCAGLAPGVYHYDPLGHRLEPVDADPGAADDVLGCARKGAFMNANPQVVISVTARFRRLAWKYEGLPYRLVLLHVGVLMQSLYLVCTAMRLAPCALGSVSITAAARAFGTDWRVEPCVGQFIVGREPDEPSPDTSDDSRWRRVNDAEWADLARGAARTAPGRDAATATGIQDRANRRQGARQPVRRPVAQAWPLLAGCPGWPAAAQGRRARG